MVARVAVRPACRFCRFWIDQDIGLSEIGVCRRFAPLPVFSTPGPEWEPEDTATWPSTEDEDWCGEFVAKSEVAQ